MIVIEIRIGRETSATGVQPSGASLASGGARAQVAPLRKPTPERWIWRLGRRGIAAAVASVLGVASLAFVPGSAGQDDALMASAAGAGSTGGFVAIGEISPHADAFPAPAHAGASPSLSSMPDTAPVVTPELDRRARQLTEAAWARVEARAVAGGVPLQLDLQPPALRADFPVESSGLAPVVPSAYVVQQVQADATREHAGAPEGAPEVEVASSYAAPPAIAVDVDAPSWAGVPAAGDVAVAALATGARAPVAAAEHVGAGGNATDDAAGSSPAPMHFSIIRAGGEAANTLPGAAGADASPGQALHAQLGTLGERAAASDWAGVRVLLEQLRSGLAANTANAPGSATSAPALALTLAKWDARAALGTNEPGRAAVAFEGLESQVDDEARALRAVALLRSGDAPRAVDAYRDLLVRAPHDARLWLGLALALESSAAAPDAARFAYLQTLELAQDEAVRAVARARLVPPQA